MLRPLAESRQNAQLRITEVLARLASSSATPLNPYVSTYLSAHAGAAGRPGWAVLADHELALDQLDPEAVAADAMRSAFGRFPLPAPVEAVVAARGDLRDTGLADRRGVREIWHARHVRHFRGTGEQSPRGERWSLLWARMERQSVHVAMSGHTFAITGIAVIPPVDGRDLVATGSRDGSVRLWDVATAAPVGDPLYSSVDVRSDRLRPRWPGLRHPITALVSFTGPGGRTVLATARLSGVDFWDPLRGEQSRPSIRCDAAVRAMTTVELRRRTVLVTGDASGAVRLWHLDHLDDPHFPVDSGTVLFRHTAAVRVAITVAHSDGRTLLLTGGDDGALRCWDVARRREVGQPLITASVPISSIAVLPLRNGTRMLALAGGDRTIRLIDLASLPRHGGLAAITNVGRSLEGHTARVLAVTALPLTRSHVVLVSAGRDGTVRLWDPGVDDWSTRRISSASSRLLGFGIGTTPALAALSPASGRSIVVSGGADGTVRIWDPSSTVDVSGENGERRRSSVGLMTTLPRPDGRRLLATAGPDGYVRWWDAHTGNAEGYPVRSERDGVPVALNSLADADEGATLVTVHDNGVVRLWSPADRWRWRRAPERRGRIRPDDAASAAAGLTFAGEHLLAIGGFGGSLSLFDLRRRGVLWPRRVGQALLGHTDTITEVVGLSAGGQTYVASMAKEDWTGEVVIWTPPFGSPSHSRGRQRGPGRLVAPRGARIVGIAVARVEDGDLLVISYADGHLVSVDPVTADTVAGPRPQDHLGASMLTVIEYTDGAPLLATGGGPWIWLWDPVRLKLLDTIDIATPILAMTGFADGCLAVGTVDGPAVLKIHRPDRDRREGPSWRPSSPTSDATP